MRMVSPLKTALAVLVLTLLVVLALTPAAMAAGSYQLVGLGPAGLDLCTPRALKAIQEADIIFCRPATKKMLAPKVDFAGKEVVEGYNLIFPYYGKPCPKGPEKAKTRWGKTCEQFHEMQAEFVAKVRQAVAQGKKVVMTTPGDPTIYGPAIWTVLALKDLKPRVVAGLSAFNAGNAALKARLGEVIITAPFTKKGQTDSLESLAGHERATMVIFMPRDLDKLMARLTKAYAADTPVGVVTQAGWPDQQRVVLGAIDDIQAKLAGKDMKRSLIYVGKALADSQYRPPQQAKGRYYLVGVGPGDPDLATLRALEVIKKADIIFAHRRIHELFAKELAGKQVIEGYHRLFPFYGRPCPKKGEEPQGRRERMSCEEYHKRQAEFSAMVHQAVAQGKTVAMLDSGDPMVYGPCNWSLTALKDIETEVVPGISCFNAANAALGVSITGGRTSHSVLTASGWTVEEMARHQATMVLFTMRTQFAKFTQALSRHYSPDTPVAIVFHAGYADQESVLRSTLGKIDQEISGRKLPFQHLLYVGDALNNPQPY